MAVVYQHRRKDTNEVFYIGIGKTRKRAYEKYHHRNQHWKSIVAKFGYEADILIEGIEWEDACKIESGMILDYGRSDLKLGSLVNQTNGGDGGYGMILKPESKEKIRQFQLSLNKKGKPGRPQSEITRNKIKISSTGRKHTEETKIKLRKPKSNKVNYKYEKSKIECPHCGKCSQPATAYRYHFDNCLVVTKKLKHEGVKYGSQKKIKCPHCDKEGGRTMHRWHFDNCKNKK